MNTGQKLLHYQKMVVIPIDRYKTMIKVKKTPSDDMIELNQMNLDTTNNITDNADDNNENNNNDDDDDNDAGGGSKDEIGDNTTKNNSDSTVHLKNNLKDLLKLPEPPADFIHNLQKTNRNKKAGGISKNKRGLQSHLKTKWIKLT